MSNKVFRKSADETSALYDEKGGYLGKLHGENDKNFAVIVKCGHCGNGYYVPVLFSSYCKDVETAVERIKAMPRVKRDYKYAVIDAFEISEIESYLIKAINANDDYLTEYSREFDDYIQERRLPLNVRINRILYDNPNTTDDELKNFIATADSFDEKYVLQRYFGPRIQGGKVTYLKKYDKNKMLEEYFTQHVYELGIKNNNIHFLTMYYINYGQNNQLGLYYYNNRFYYQDVDGNVFDYVIDENNLRWIMESGVLTRDKLIEKCNLEEKEKTEFFSGREIKRETASDKFKRRMAKYNKNNSSNAPKSGGREMV